MPQTLPQYQENNWHKQPFCFEPKGCTIRLALYKQIIKIQTHKVLWTELSTFS